MSTHNDTLCNLALIIRENKVLEIGGKILNHDSLFIFTQIRKSFLIVNIVIHLSIDLYYC